MNLRQLDNLAGILFFPGTAAHELCHEAVLWVADTEYEMELRPFDLDRRSGLYLQQRPGRVLHFMYSFAPLVLLPVACLFAAAAGYVASPVLSVVYGYLAVCLWLQAGPSKDDVAGMSGDAGPVTMLLFFVVTAVSLLGGFIGLVWAYAIAL
jgi:hypothetical protein